jgi:hypothetical protein
LPSLMVTSFQFSITELLLLKSFYATPFQQKVQQPCAPLFLLLIGIFTFSP